MVNSKSEKGQAIPLLIVALGLLLMGGLGLAIDGAQLYSQSQLAQVAADAAATAGAMSMFQGVNVKGKTTYFDTSKTSITCTTSDTELPCQYAQLNGFGTTANDQVVIDFPTCTGSPDPCGYESTLSTTDTPNQIRVTITRNVANSFIRLLGGALTTQVKASATAAIVVVQSPAPIIVTDPSNQDTLTAGGSTQITICGGPSRSVQVNSNNAKAFEGAHVDLSHAGPLDAGDCKAGTGADFGVFGGQAGPTPPSGVSLGTAGHYVQPASPILDPLANVPAPSVPAPVANPNGVKIPKGTDDCTFTNCYEYSPGLYTGGIDVNSPAIFKPGLYYIQSTKGFHMKQVSGGATNYSAMCVDCAADPDTGNGVVIYDSGPAGSTSGHNPSGGFQFDNQNNIIFQGAPSTSKYQGIVFWEDRTADAQTHKMGQGNGGFSVVGTIYLTNTLAIMQADPSHYQEMHYQGTPVGNTTVTGEIIVGQLSLGGNSSLLMNLNPNSSMKIRQVALVAGGPHP